MKNPNSKFKQILWLDLSIFTYSSIKSYLYIHLYISRGSANGRQPHQHDDVDRSDEGVSSGAGESGSMLSLIDQAGQVQCLV